MESQQPLFHIVMSRSKQVNKESTRKVDCRACPQGANCSGLTCACPDGYTSNGVKCIKSFVELSAYSSLSSREKREKKRFSPM